MSIVTRSGVVDRRADPIAVTLVVRTNIAVIRAERSRRKIAGIADLVTSIGALRPADTPIARVHRTGAARTGIRTVTEYPIVARG